MTSASIPPIDPELPRISPGTSTHAGPAGGQKGVTFQNWAQTFTCAPELFFRPESVSQVQEVSRHFRDTVYFGELTLKIVQRAREKNKHLTVVGAGHSPGDIVCTEDYLVSLDKLCHLLEVNKSERHVKVQAGMRLYQLHHHLDNHAFGMSNLGSISEQSIGGFIATATHGSSMKHSILSQCIVQLTIVLADGTIRICSRSQNKDLFQAALVSLGALGVIVDVTFKVSDAFDVQSTQSIVNFQKMLQMWRTSQLWDQAEFVRVWWFPYSEKTIVWKGDRIAAGTLPHKTPKSWYRGTFWAYHVQQALLYVGRLLPSLGPSIERTVFSQHYGTQEGQIAESVEKSFVSLNMNCLFSQYVNEWSIPLDKGIEACERLQLWLDGKEEEARIPFSSKGVFVHAPIELRVATTDNEEAWLSPTWGGPICYIGVIMYKPFYRPVSYRRYFQAYEYLMDSLGGRPHWAKQHSVPQNVLLTRYPKLQDWLQVRETVDPARMFTTEYHRRHLLDDTKEDLGVFHGMAGRRFKARL